MIYEMKRLAERERSRGTALPRHLPSLPRREREYVQSTIWRSYHPNAGCTIHGEVGNPFSSFVEPKLAWSVRGYLMSNRFGRCEESYRLDDKLKIKSNPDSISLHDRDLLKYPMTISPNLILNQLTIISAMIKGRQ